MGLPYEEEPSITKHLAAFIKRAQLNKAPDYVLFNGGAMKPSLFKSHFRFNEQLVSSFSDPAIGNNKFRFGSCTRCGLLRKVRRGLGIRIGGGTPKSYYLEIEVKT